MCVCVCVCVCVCMYIPHRIFTTLYERLTALLWSRVPHKTLDHAHSSFKMKVFEWGNICMFVFWLHGTFNI